MSWLLTVPLMSLRPAPVIAQQIVTEQPIPPKIALGLIEAVLEPSYPKIEDYTTPLAKNALERRKRAEERARAEAAARIVTPAPVYFYSTPVQLGSGNLTGSYGYAVPGNCVNEIPLGIRPNGNPISWPATTQAPYIGAVALFSWNHTGRVVGIWSNGDLEIAHQGWWGPPKTRFPRSSFRGFR